MADPYSAYFCGGSVYSDRWIITAAHCVVKLTPAQVTITAGTNRLIATAIRRNIKRIIVHKDYNKATSDNDIALIELLDPLPLGAQIKAVPLLTTADENARLRTSAREPPPPLFPDKFRHAPFIVQSGFALQPRKSTKNPKEFAPK